MIKSEIRVRAFIGKIQVSEFLAFVTLNSKMRNISVTLWRWFNGNKIIIKVFLALPQNLPSMVN